MDVTNSSFEEVLAHLKSILPSCSFICLDLEFTGLGAVRPSHLDTPALRYAAARDSALPYPPLQAGLTLFRRAPEDGDVDCSEGTSFNGWEALPFNFTLCPRAVFRSNFAKYPVVDREIRLQSSSLDFLVRHGFNFQHAFENGISWLRPDHEAAARAELKSLRTTSTGPGLDIRPENRPAVEAVRAAVKAWLAESPAPEAGSIRMIPLPSEGIHRKLSQQMIMREFPRIIVTPIFGGHITLFKRQFRLQLAHSEKQAREANEETMAKEAEKAFSRRMLEAIGFRRVTDLLLESKKPLVLHHGLLDLTKTIANFVEELPKDLGEFKKLLQARFPCVWDTRVMLADAAASYPWIAHLLSAEQGRSIPTLLEALQNKRHMRDVPPMHVRPYRGYDKFSQEHSGPESPRKRRRISHHFQQYFLHDQGHYAHEAGYDALNTGRLFLLLLGMLHKEEWVHADILQNVNDHAKSLKNRIYLGSCGGYADMDLAVEREEDEDRRNAYFARKDVLVISGIEKSSAELALVAEIPYFVYYNIAKEILQGTSYNPKASRVFPVDNGSFMIVPSRRKEERSPDTAVTGPAETNGADGMDLANCGHDNVVALRQVSEVEPQKISDNCGDEDIARIRQAVLDRGLTVETYASALSKQRPGRTRLKI